MLGKTHTLLGQVNFEKSMYHYQIQIKDGNKEPQNVYISDMYEVFLTAKRLGESASPKRKPRLTKPKAQ